MLHALEMQMSQNFKPGISVPGFLFGEGFKQRMSHYGFTKRHIPENNIWNNTTKEYDDDDFFCTSFFYVSGFCVSGI